jgi:sugar/nucleoside kinase (ribokinase family)
LAIDFLTIGHITHDRVPGGIRLGGTVSYAAVTARRLGRRPAILTRGVFDGLSAELNEAAVSGQVHESLTGIEVHLLASPVSTTFTNIYHDGRRVQVIEAVAGPILPAELPPDLAETPIVLLGPVAGELPPDWADAFPNSLLGISPQGWMRAWDAAGHVRPAPWTNADRFLQRADVLFLSREDVAGDDGYIAKLAQTVRMMVVTDGWHGSTVYQDGKTYRVAPRQAAEVDPTGAGDVFATSFLIRLAETGDPVAAARFANVVASFSVEAIGIAGIPERSQVEAWLASQG